MISTCFIQRNKILFLVQQQADHSKIKHNNQIANSAIGKQALSFKDNYNKKEDRISSNLDVIFARNPNKPDEIISMNSK